MVMQNTAAFIFYLLFMKTSAVISYEGHKRVTKSEVKKAFEEIKDLEVSIWEEIISQRKNFLISEINKIQCWEEKETSKREVENPEASKIIQTVKSLRDTYDRRYDRIPNIFDELKEDIKEALAKKFKKVTAGNVDIDEGVRDILAEQKNCGNKLNMMVVDNITLNMTHFDRLIKLYMELDEFSEISPEEKESREISLGEERIRREESLERESIRSENQKREILERRNIEAKNIFSRMDKKAWLRIGITTVTPLILGGCFSLVFGTNVGLGIAFISSISILIFSLMPSVH